MENNQRSTQMHLPRTGRAGRFFFGGVLRWALLFVFSLLGAFGCADPDSFTGRYQGVIIGADFLRRGFAQEVSVELEITLLDARRATGTITTSDGTFSQSPIGSLGAASVDLLGDADFPGTNPIIMFLSAPMQSGEEATLILTFGGESGDELRVAYGRDGTPESRYGIFPIQRISE